MTEGPVLPCHATQYNLVRAEITTTNHSSNYSTVHNHTTLPAARKIQWRTRRPIAAGERLFQQCDPRIEGEDASPLLFHNNNNNNVPTITTKHNNNNSSHRVEKKEAVCLDTVTLENPHPHTTTTNNNTTVFFGFLYPRNVNFFVRGVQDSDNFN